MKLGQASKDKFGILTFNDGRIVRVERDEALAIKAGATPSCCTEEEWRQGRVTQSRHEFEVGDYAERNGYLVVRVAETLFVRFTPEEWSGNVRVITVNQEAIDALHAEGKALELIAVVDNDMVLA